MSIKNEILKRIARDVEKLRAKKINAANNKSLESAVFDFFKNIDESRQVHGGKKYDETLFSNAKRSLSERLQGYAPKTKVSIEFNASEDLTANIHWSEQQVRGVTIWWSQAYITKNNVDPSLYIDVSQMLFF